MIRALKTVAIATSLSLVGLSAAAEAQVFYVNNNSAYDVAEKAMRAGELGRASKFYKRAIKGAIKGELLLAAYNNLCAVDLALGNLKAAEKACSGAISENRLYWRAYVNRGHVRSALGDNRLAVKDLNKALKLQPNSKLVKRVLARVQQKQRTFAEVR